VRIIILLATISIANAGPPRAPDQPRTGPGGADYRHGSVAVSVHGEGGTQYWLFEPREPKAEKAPLVIFLHGYSVMEPEGYRAWINHIVRRGAVVVYPRYQGRLLTPPGEFLPNSMASIRDALKVLAERGRVQPDLNRVAAVGHSAGGVIALNYTLDARAAGLPVPKALVVIEPGGGQERGLQWVATGAAGGLAPETRFVAAVGDADRIVGVTSARLMWRSTGHLQQRAFVTVQSDLHGDPRLRAGHLSPMAVEGLADVHDWRAWWRVFDAACESAFDGHDLKIDSDLGKWSDGTPLKPLQIER
jgi:alpha-beta hydrolase superfamily lysophospholipase